ncbi:hypothetical protein TEA_007658 [Camellia sinensis var. sinensis]|uniref:Peptidase M3A/M3B catalytic domain-containing protein n=1 Tax=Camellia sinensis var. sinensis TaxID=542762 RepID=A0A4S4D9Z3_CAMSN|nr:hypothetical protein TEA_007658 [Camellia sinensis var. sinensis]
MPKCVLCLYSLRFLIHQKKEEGDFPFGIEDLLYYVKRIKEQQFNLDLGALKQYFPFNLVMSGILKICQDLFGLRFEEIADAEVFGTLMFTFIQSMTYLLIPVALLTSQLQKELVILGCLQRGSQKIPLRTRVLLYGRVLYCAEAEVVCVYSLLPISSKQSKAGHVPFQG